VAAVAPQALAADEATRPVGREVPKLSLVTPDYEPNGPNWPEPASKVTRQMPEVAGPGSPNAQPPGASAARRSARVARPSLLSTNSGRLLIGLLALLVLAAAGGGYLMLKGRNSPTALVAGTATAAMPTQPLPTPTGFGDATNTPVPTHTPAPPPANVIGVNGWVQVQASGLTVRDAPSKSGKRITALSNGTKAHVKGGPQQADGYTWWQIDQYDAKNPAASGWSAGQFLAPIPAP